MFNKKQPENEELELGKKYKDLVHGYEGVATQHCRYITGCDRVFLENIEKNEAVGIWFDITQIADVEIKPENQKPGGPQKTESSKLGAPR